MPAVPSIYTYYILTIIKDIPTAASRPSIYLAPKAAIFIAPKATSKVIPMAIPKII